MKILLIVNLLTWSLMCFSQTQSENADVSAEQTRELLISKLEKVNLNLAPADPSKIVITLRLADLFAERARVQSMKELEGNCTICTAGTKDRTRALGLYLEALPRVSEVNCGRVLIQVGHLYELTGKESEALQLYQKTLKEVQDPTLRAEASLSLAEIYFKKTNYKEARNYYAQVLAQKTAASRGLAAYRLAWSEFNLKQLPAAISGLKQILKTPELQTRTGVAEAQGDRQFQEEVSRDLAVFLSKQTFDLNEVKELYQLSPESTRLQNVVTMASEMERLGKKKESAEVWSFALNHESQPAERLEADVHLVPLYFDEKDTTPSLRQMEKSLALWQELKGCGKTDCNELYKILRGFVINWNQTEKKQPSENLIKAYSLYMQQFKSDSEMALWGAQAARERKDLVATAGFLELAIEDIKSDEKSATQLEAALLTYLEVAEASSDSGLWAKAANLYLSTSPKKTKIFEVRYQLAKKIYDAADYAKSAESLKELALIKDAPVVLREQAAHLSLDALAMLKDDARLGVWSQEYANLFPGSSSAEFSNIQQKSILTQSAKTAETDVEKAWLDLQKFDSRKATDEDRQVYLKNKILLAEKTSRFDLASAAVDDYLAVPGLSAPEREFALGKKTWLAELRLDFSTALKSAVKLEAKALAPDQKALKLALYADLAGVGSQIYYQQFLNLSKDEEAKRGVAAELIRSSLRPQNELEKYSLMLAKAPDLLGRLYAEVIGKLSGQPGQKLILGKALSDVRIQNTPWGKAFQRNEILKDLQPINDKLKSQKLDSSAQKALTKTIKTRATDLQKLETVAARALKNGDWSSQLVTLSALGKETDRFYHELLALPMPEGLSPAEESQFMQMLGQQAAPYHLRADELKAKVSEFWQTAGWQEALTTSVQKSGEFRYLVTTEIAALKEISTPENQAFFVQLESTSVGAEQPRPPLALVENARNEVRAHPFDHSRIEKLKDLEQQGHNFAMVQYLEGRLKATQKEQSHD